MSVLQTCLPPHYNIPLCNCSSITILPTYMCGIGPTTSSFVKVAYFSRYTQPHKLVISTKRRHTSTQVAVIATTLPTTQPARTQLKLKQSLLVGWQPTSINPHQSITSLFSYRATEQQQHGSTTLSLLCSNHNPIPKSNLLEALSQFLSPV